MKKYILVISVLFYSCDRFRTNEVLLNQYNNELLYTHEKWKDNPSGIVMHFSDKHGRTETQDVNNEMFNKDNLFIVEVKLFRNSLRNPSIKQLKFYLEKEHKIWKIKDLRTQ